MSSSKAFERGFPCWVQRCSRRGSQAGRSKPNWCPLPLSHGGKVFLEVRTDRVLVAVKISWC